MTSKLITVFGATGRQGGSVAFALLAKGYRVRGVTRNSKSNEAKNLAINGIELAEASYEDIESLKRAIYGSYGVFLVTTAGHAEGDFQQGKNVVDMCKAAGVQHLVFSGLENVRKIMGKRCSHYDGKGQVEEYMFSQGLPVATTVRYPFYMENLMSISKPRKTGNNTYQLNIPMGDVPMDMLDVAGAGPAVAALFDSPTEFNGKVVGLSGDKKTIKEMAQIFSQVFAPKQFIVSNFSLNDLRSYGMEDFANMYEFKIANKCKRDVDLTYRLNPATKNLETWLNQQRQTFLSIIG